MLADHDGTAGHTQVKLFGIVLTNEMRSQLAAELATIGVSLVAASLLAMS